MNARRSKTGASETSRRRGALLPDAARESFKIEIAKELGLLPRIERDGWAELPTRELGRIGGPIGGRMVRVMIRHAEEALLRGERI